jgi:glycerophosphoryl diester phosphodiesterase
MELIHSIEPLLLRMMDGIFACLPQPIPSKEFLKRVTIFSHRGEHDNLNIMENSMDAFERAYAAGVGGIEFDVRWTSDLVPMVFHDPDLKRIFDVPKKIADFSMQTLRREFPVIPSLDEVVAGFGRRLHFMIELKQEHFPTPKKQAECLLKTLNPIKAERDFHLISFTPDLFKIYNGFSSNTYLPIVRFFAKSMSMQSIENSFGGITGHYLFITKLMIDRHHRRLQKIGTGFVHSRSSLFREINRGIDWIFSNRAAYLQKLVNDLIDCDKLRK